MDGNARDEEAVTTWRRSGVPTDVIHAIKARLDARSAFSCPWRTSDPPCSPHARTGVPFVDGLGECPLLDTEPCGPAAAWRMQRRAADDEAWTIIAQRVRIPRRFWAAALDTSRPTDALTAIQDYLTGGHFASGGCVILSGDTGTGKTWAACAALRAVQQSIAFLPFADIAAKAVSWSDKEANRRTALTAHLLVLDDVGAGESNPAADVALDAILNHREGEMLPTIVTTNLPFASFWSKLSDRSRSRLQGPWGRQVQVWGSDLRVAEAAPPRAF